MRSNGLHSLIATALGTLALVGCGQSSAAVLTSDAAFTTALAAATTLASENPALDLPSLTTIASEAAPQVISVPTLAQRPVAAPQTGNSALLYVSPNETLPAVEQQIANAHHAIYLESFNFGTSYAQHLAPQLIAKAKAGVEVRVLIDYVGSRFLKGYSDLVAQLRAGGVDVEVYKPYLFKDPAGHESFNIIHRKVYLFDGTRALIGGVNLAAPFDTTTQDLLILWQGPVLQPLYSEFTHDWQHVTKTPLGSQPVTTPAGNVDAQVMVTSPGEGRYEIRNEVSAHIDAAKASIIIENQYLWDDAFLAHLVAAAKRGVQVRILLPGAEQKAIQRQCNALSMNALVAAGAQCRRYNGVPVTAHLHTKYYAIDDNWAATGSCNADTRSLTDNQELDVATTNPELVQQLRTRLFERDWSSFSTPYVVTPVGPIASKLDSILDLIDYYL